MWIYDAHTSTCPQSFVRPISTLMNSTHEPSCWVGTYGCAKTCTNVLRSCQYLSTSCHIVVTSTASRRSRQKCMRKVLGILITRNTTNYMAECRTEDSRKVTHSRWCCLNDVKLQSLVLQVSAKLNTSYQTSTITVIRLNAEHSSSGKTAKTWVYCRWVHESVLRPCQTRPKIRHVISTGIRLLFSGWDAISAQQTGCWCIHVAHSKQHLNPDADVCIAHIIENIRIPLLHDDGKIDSMHDRATFSIFSSVQSYHICHRIIRNGRQPVGFGLSSRCRMRVHVDRTKVNSQTHVRTHAKTYVNSAHSHG